jgi:probable blue pigment (indigoidine) exporter
VLAAVAAEAVGRPRVWLAFVALGIVWGSAWVAADSLAEYVPPLRGAVARFSLSALLCLLVILWRGLKLPRGRPLAFLLTLSLTMIALPSVLLLWAQPRLPAATVAVLFAAMPLLVAVLNPTVVPQRALKACIVGLGAMTLVVGALFSVSQAGGAAVVFLVVASIAFSVLLARRELTGVHPVVITALLLGGAAVLLFLAGLVLERGQRAEWNPRAVGSVILLAALCGAPAYATYFWLLQRLEAHQVVTLQWIEPLVALAESALFLRVGLTFNIVLGSVAILVCLFLVMRAHVEDDNPVSFSGTS